MYPSFLDPYDKVIYLRKKYKITQKELAGDFYSQAYITKLETGKQKPTMENMQYFACKLNQIFKQRKIPVVVCYNDLILTKEEAVQDFFDKEYNELKILKESDLSSLTTFETIINDLKINEVYLNAQQKFLLYKEISEKAFGFRSFDIAKLYSFNLILECILLKEYKEIQNAIIIQTRASIIMGNYQFFTELQNLIEPFLEKFKPSNKEIIYMNFSVIAGRLKDYNTSLKFLKRIDEEISIKKNFFKKEVQKAYIYDQLGKYDFAKKIYTSLIKNKSRDIEFLIFAKINLIDIYVKENDTINIKKNYFYIKKNVELGNPLFLKKRYKILADTAIFLNKKKDSIYFLNKALYKAKNQKFEEEYIDVNYDCIRLLLSRYKKKDHSKVLELESLYFSLLKNKARFEIGYSFIEYFLLFKYKESLNNFLSKQKKLINYVQE